MIYGIVVPDKPLLVKLDKDGTVQWGKFYQTDFTAFTPKYAIQTKDKGFVMTGHDKNNTVLFKVNAAGGLLWSKKVNAEPLSIGLLAETQSGNIMAVGNGYRFDYTNERGIDFYITLFDKNGVPNNCTHSSTAIRVENRNFTVQNLSPTYTANPFTTFNNHNVVSNSKTLPSKLLCPCITVGYLDTTICAGSSVKIANKIYDKTTIDTLVLRNQLGCDSLLYLRVSALSPIEKNIEKTVCQGDAYTFGGKMLTKTGIYTLKLLSKSGCDSTIILDLTVQDTFAKNLEVKICEGETYSFYSKTLTKSGVYTEKVKAPSGCDSSFILKLTVNPKPSFQYEKEQSITITAGDTIKLKPCATGIRYEWTPKELLTCSTCDTPSVFSAKDVLVKAKILNETGCFTECRFNIQIKPNTQRLKATEVYIPNTFSPNNDGNNDVFQVRNPKIKVLALDIYNRWGNLISQQIGENAQWDGVFNGKILPDDTYVYVLRYTDLSTQKEEIIFGDLTLIR